MGFQFRYWHLQPGDHISYRDGDGGRRLLRIGARRRNGYRVSPFADAGIEAEDEDAKTELSDEELNQIILSRDYQHHPCDISRLDERHRQLLFREWEHFSPKMVFEAREYRATIVEAVQQARACYSKDQDCIEAVLDELWQTKGEVWSSNESAIATEDRKAKAARAKDPVDPETIAWHVPVRKKPSWRTVCEWWKLWLLSGRDARVLLPLYDQRGNRNPKLDPRVYEFMELVTNRLWLKPPRKHKTSVHSALRKLCEAEQLDVPHYTTLWRFIDGYVDAADEDRAIYGWRSRFLRFTAHAPVPPPTRPLEQVEIDHCLLDAFVRDERTGKLLGRPWLTVIIDRLTRVICGIHLSWELPSYASVQRALAHAMWPKDLAPFNGDLKHDWPVCGVPEVIFSDQGREFKSFSLAEAERSMQFEVVRLKRKRPWLKGRIERAFKTIQMKVFSHKEGAIVYKGVRDLDHYDPAKSTEITLGELRRDLLKWIVDDYHHQPHSGLRAPNTGRLETPMEAFMRGVAVHRVRPPKSWSEIIQLIGTASTRTIQKSGIKLLGLTYWHRRLNTLLARRGGKEARWKIRIDPFDIGRLWLFDDHPIEGGWLQVECTRQDLSDGVSIYQHREHRKKAYRGKKGGSVSAKAILKAKQQCEELFRRVMSEVTSVATASRQARYGHPNGTYFTPLMGMSPEEAAYGLSVVDNSLLCRDADDKVQTGIAEQAIASAVVSEVAAAPACAEVVSGPDPDALGGPSADGFDLRKLLAQSDDWSTA